MHTTLGIFAHTDSGKTTFTEMLLVLGKLISQAGSIEEGTTESDQLPEEIERGISIRTSYFSIQYQNVNLQIIDTPGHIDFRSQIRITLPVLDAAILLLDSGFPVQSQARLLMQELKNLEIPILYFINKLDIHEDYTETLVSLESLLQKRTFPIFQKTNDWEYFFSNPEKFSQVIWEDAVSLQSDNLEKYLQFPDFSIVAQTLVDAFFQSKVIPVIGGSAKMGYGVKEALDFLTFPSKFQKTRVQEENQILARRNLTEMGRAIICRRGTKDIKVTSPLLVLQGLGWEEGEPKPGQIFAKRPEEEKFPLETDLNFFFSWEPESDSDLAECLEELEICLWEDPTYHNTQTELGTFLIRGEGELHLEILQERWLSRFKKKLQFGRIQVASYDKPKKLTKKVSFEHQAFGTELSSGVLEVFLEDTASFSKPLAFEVSLPESWQQSISESFEEALERGIRGREIVGLTVRVLDYKPPTGSQAKYLVLLKVAILAGLKTELEGFLEKVGPSTDFELWIPSSSLGTVLADLNRRVAKILSLEEGQDGFTTLVGTAPTEKLLGFSGALRNMTKGIGISWERTAFTYDKHAVLKE